MKRKILCKGILIALVTILMSCTRMSNNSSSQSVSSNSTISNSNSLSGSSTNSQSNNNSDSSSSLSSSSSLESSNSSSDSSSYKDSSSSDSSITNSSSSQQSTSSSNSSTSSNSSNTSSSTSSSSSSTSNSLSSESSSYTDSSSSSSSDSLSSSSSDNLSSSSSSDSSSDSQMTDSSSSSSTESSSSDNSSSSSESNSSSDSSSSQEEQYTQLEIETVIDTHIGQKMNVIGQVKRNKPNVTNGGLERYPTYGTSLKNITVEEKQNILDEDATLRSSSSTYTSMDEHGNLYLNGVSINKQLFKHTAAEDMYYGNVDENEMAVVKEISINPRPMGNYITGLYAPAGEVIKIEMSDKDLLSTGGIQVTIGQASQNNQINNIWKERNDFCRMPNIANIMNVTSTEAYVGYALGGPIYITPNNTNKPFKVTISGAVEYPHFIYGLTTKSDLKRMETLSAPYFDLEIWDNAVRHSGPRKYANLDYDNLMKTSNLWYNIVKTSKQLISGSNAQMGITFIYDPFIAAGAAVAFVGRNWCNLPPDWMTSSINYEDFTTNGVWGTIHEYNHHFQRFGFAPGDEVTNNAASILSYINYTNISSKRSQNDNTLPDWQRYTDPSRSLRETIAGSKTTTAQSSLNTYVDIIHTFGVDVFIKAALYAKGAGGVDNWYKALCETTNYDMTYYFETMLHQNVSTSLKETYNDGHLPMFVPVASLYQTGRNYFVGEDEYFVETVKPYQIDYDKDFDIDLNKYLFVPDGFNFTVKNITQPTSGSIVKTNENIYKYIPGKEEYSGKLNLTISLTHDYIQAKDVTLTLEFKQAYLGLKATKYIYDTQIYKTVSEAVENDFEGYTTKEELNYTTSFMNGINPQTIGLIEGKIYVPEDGKYRLCFRSARGNNVLYTAVNSNNLVETLNLTGNNNQFTDEGVHVVEFDVKAGDFIYFKEITMSYGSNDAYMELGWGLLQEDNHAKVDAIPSKYLMNSKYDYQGYTFTFEEKYVREYSVNSIMADKKLQSIVSVENYGPWDNNYKIENIIDGNDNTSFHSQNGKLISSAPFIVTIDLGTEVTCDTLYLTGYNRATRHMPTTFKIYGGLSLDEMDLLGEYVDHPFEERNMIAKFKQSTIRYYRLVVTDTDTKQYVAISEVNVGIDFSGKEVSLDKATYYNFEINRDVLSTYGHTIEGDGYLIYNFDGSRFGLYAIQNESCQIEVTIDGEVEVVDLSDTFSKELVYLTEKLDNGNHQVKIKVLNGKLSVDSFIID